MAAIKCDVNVGSTFSRLIASVDDFYYTDETWRCTSVAPGAGWAAVDFDDSAWDNAVVDRSFRASTIDR